MFLRVAFPLQQRRLISQCPILFKGHSKWDNIKSTKGKLDMLKSRQTSFLLAKAKAAVKLEGFDMKLNRKLAAIQQEFREKSLPLDTLTGFLTKIKNKPETTIHFEFIGPSGSFFIIEAETDSVGKTKGDVQKNIKKIGGFRPATDLRRRFDEKIIASVSGKRDGKDLTLEEVEEIAIELDCEEVVNTKDGEDESSPATFELTFSRQNQTKLEDEIKSKGLEVETIEQRLIPTFKVTVTSEENAVIEKFYSLMQEIEEIKGIYDNLE